ncbi:MAG: hypothetical protein ACRCS9_00395 [Hyphomicrobium sp.]
MISTSMRLALLAVGCALVVSASADAAPKKPVMIDAPHDVRVEGRRVCFLDHDHYGSSSGQANRRAAEASAAASWANFVDFEYGSAWASYVKASSKKMTCEQSTSGWGCSLEARPCR